MHPTLPPSLCAAEHSEEVLALLGEDIDELFGRIEASLFCTEENNDNDCLNRPKFMNFLSSRLFHKSTVISLADAFHPASGPTETTPISGSSSVPLSRLKELEDGTIDAREVFSFLLRLRGRITQLSSLYYFFIFIRRTFHQLALDMLRRHQAQFSDLAVARRKTRVVLSLWCGDLKETFYHLVFPSLSFLQQCSSSSDNVSLNDRQIPLSSAALCGEKTTDLGSSTCHSLSSTPTHNVPLEGQSKQKQLNFFTLLKELEGLFMDIAVCQCSNLVPFVIPLALYFPPEERERSRAEGLSSIRFEWSVLVMEMMWRTRILPSCTPAFPTSVRDPQRAETAELHSGASGKDEDKMAPFCSLCPALEAISFLSGIVSEMPLHLSPCTTSFSFSNSSSKHGACCQESIEHELIEENVRRLEQHKVLLKGKPLHHAEEKMISSFRKEENAMKKLHLYDLPCFGSETSTLSRKDAALVYIGCLALIQFLCKAWHPSSLTRFVSLTSLFDTLLPVFYLCFDLGDFFCREAQKFVVYLLDQIPLRHLMSSYPLHGAFNTDNHIMISLPRMITMQSSSLHFLEWVKKRVEEDKNRAAGEDEKSSSQQGSTSSPSSSVALLCWTVGTVASSFNVFQRHYFDLIKLVMENSLKGDEISHGADYRALTMDLLERCPPKERIEYIFLLISAAPHASVAQHFLRMLTLDWKAYQKSLHTTSITSLKVNELHLENKASVHFEVLFPQLLIDGLDQLFRVIECGGRFDLIDTVIRFLNFFATFIAEDRRSLPPSGSRCVYRENGRILVQVNDDLQRPSRDPCKKVWHGAVVALKISVLPKCDALLNQIEEDPSRSLDAFSLSSILTHLKEYF